MPETGEYYECSLQSTPQNLLEVYCYLNHQEAHRYCLMLRETDLFNFGPTKLIKSFNLIYY